MFVAVSVLKDSLAVTQLAEENGQLVSTDNVVDLQPSSKLGHVPYERLRVLGDGVHELSDDERAVPWVPREVVHIPWGGWLFFAVVAALLAVLGYWMFDNWEAEGGRMRIHWLVAAVYAFAGKEGVAGAFGAGSVVSLVMCIKTWVTGSRRLDEKRQRLAEELTEIMGDKSRISVDDYETKQGLYVGQDAGLLHLFLPQDYLTKADEKRAKKILGPPEQGYPDPNFPEATPPSAFSEQLGSDPTAAADRVIEVMAKVYGLHPYFQLSVHSHISVSDDNEWPESADEEDSDYESSPWSDPEPAIS